uniref:Nuclear receptor domain-containing protein n=1 Tax=Heterorhabditis bacteriophora TaxID=37862 RepID=A0A1I7XBT7_HETBA
MRLAPPLRFKTNATAMLVTPISVVLYHELPISHSKKREKIPEGTLCVVCADLASGIHYSVPSCNGCKTFFRRALVNKQTFTCQYSGDCVVGKCEILYDVYVEVVGSRNVSIWAWTLKVR